MRLSKNPSAEPITETSVYTRVSRVGFSALGTNGAGAERGNTESSNTVCAKRLCRAPTVSTAFSFIIYRISSDTHWLLHCFGFSCVWGAWF